MFLEEKKIGEVAGNFMTPAKLNIDQDTFDALVQVLGLLESGRIEYSMPLHKRLGGHVEGPLAYFNMGWANCGTVGCIAGWANQLSNGKAFPGCNDRDWWFEEKVKGPLRDLLLPIGLFMGEIHPARAAKALRNYLTVGAPCWIETRNI